MKKSLIATAGVAAFAVAAMPAAVFAATNNDTTITDQLEVTVNTACSFVRYGAAGAGSQTNVTTGPAWSGVTTAEAANTTTGKYSATLNPGATVELGTSSFTAYCNATGGFDVTVDTPDLANGNDKISYSGTAIASDASGWTLTKGSDIFNNTEGAKFMSAASETDAANAVTATAKYTVKTLTTTPSGTYSGDVVYTFSYDDPNAS